MTQLNVKVKRLHPDAVLPQFATEGSAGFDLVAVEDVIIEPGETVKVPLGLAFELPPGYEMQIRPRSGVTLKTHLRVQLGTVDADYRGEVSAIVDNGHEVYRIEGSGNIPFGKSFGVSGEIIEDFVKRKHGSFVLRKGDRIAQGVIQLLPSVTFKEVETLSETDRGEGGFGSTGTNTKEDE